MIKKLILLLFFLAIPLALEARDLNDKVFNAEHFTLNNGLEIVVIPNHRTPVVTHMVWYKVGAADEQPGKSGTAHFLEHLMFKGSANLKPGEFSEKVRALGGHDNAFTGQDYTAYFQSVPAEHLETVMRMEAGRMHEIALPPEEVDSERKVIIEERRQRTDNNPAARLSEQLYAALFVNHPYGTPVIGWEHEMAALTREDEKNFHDLWYAPNNAILVVSGDVTGEQAHRLAEKIYGPIPRRDTPQRWRPVSPPLSAVPMITLRDPDVREPGVQKIFRVPGARNNKRGSLALQVLEEIMGGGPTSRIYKALVVDQKIASGAGLYYRGDVWDDSDLTLYATPAPGEKPEDVLAALDEQMRLLVQGGVSDAELQAAITRMQASAVYALDSLSGPAMVIGRTLATGSSLDDVEYWPRDIAGVTAAQVQEAAQRYLDPDHAGDHPPVVGFLLPPEPEPAAGEETPTEEQAP